MSIHAAIWNATSPLLPVAGQVGAIIAGLYVVVQLFQWWLKPSFHVDLLLRSQDDLDLNGVPQTTEAQYTSDAEVIAGEEAELELRYTPQYIGQHVLRTTVGFANATGESDEPVIQGPAERLFMAQQLEKGVERDVGIDQHGNLKITYQQPKFMPLYRRESLLRSFSKLVRRKITWNEFRERQLLGESLHNPINVIIPDPGSYTLFARITTESDRLEKRVTVNAIQPE